MTNDNSGSRISLVGKLKSRRWWWLAAAAAVFVALFAASTANAGVSPPNGMETPTPTTEPEPGAMVFVGDIAVTEPNSCGGGTITLTLTPGDPGDGIASVAVADFFVVGSAQSLTIPFDPAIPIDPDGSFSNTDSLPPPFEAISATLAGTFDFSADPATVAGTITVGAAAAPLCQADYTGEALPAGVEPPTPEPTAEPVPAELPATGASVASGAGDGDVFWAVVAGGFAAVIALGAAGAVALRRFTS